MILISLIFVAISSVISPSVIGLTDFFVSGVKTLKAFSFNKYHRILRIKQSQSIK